jgi:DMATS type aromatic prenyltransferase
MSNCHRAWERTFLDVALGRFDRLCMAASLPSAARVEASRTIAAIFARWGQLQIGRTPPTESEITDDHGPIEFSLALNGASPEVRWLFETLGRDASLPTQWDAGLHLHELLERYADVNLERFRLIQDLFVPTAPEARFAIWHSMCVNDRGSPKFKVYLNPQAQGRERAEAVVAEAVRRLGFPQAAQAVTRLRRSDDELKFFSLDLRASPCARVKIYKVHHRATRSDIEAELNAGVLGSREDLLSFFDAFATADASFRCVPLSTYLSLTSEADRPTTATVHFPVRAYTESDQVVYDRVRALLQGSDRAIYERAIAAFAARPLNAGVGMHTYVSLRQHTGPRRITIYLAPELYHVTPARKAVA